MVEKSKLHTLLEGYGKSLKGANYGAAEDTVGYLTMSIAVFEKYSERFAKECSLRAEGDNPDSLFFRGNAIRNALGPLFGGPVSNSGGLFAAPNAQGFIGGGGGGSGSLFGAQNYSGLFGGNGGGSGSLFGAQNSGGLFGGNGGGSGSLFGTQNSRGLFGGRALFDTGRQAPTSEPASTRVTRSQTAASRSVTPESTSSPATTRKRARTPASRTSRSATPEGSSKRSKKMSKE